MVFFANLILLVIAVPSYLYVDSLIPKTASFQVTDLIIDQTWIQVGEPAQISVNVTNVGDETSNYTVTLIIDDEPIATKTVQLSGLETATLDFTATGITEGDHTVKIGDLTGSLKVTMEAPTRPAEIQVTDLGVSWTEAAVGETLIVSATATNIGDEGGSFSLDLFVNGEKRETRNIQLGSGETTTVEFEVVEAVEGTYVVKVRDLTKSFEITSEAQPVKPAEFQVTALEVSPSLVLANEVVSVSVKVTNVG
ncbi:hypothetical protein KAS24_02455, partial [Candidatus Bathyarchaeota archaeon]|nr:hypothetical protein [Candidatus Bathyarchaeota archaeon]